MHVRKAETEKPFRPRRIGAVGGFDLRLGRDMFGWPALLIARTGRDEAVKCETDLTPLGLVSRLEHALTRFEASLAEMRGMIAQAETWLPSLQSRLGVPFALQGELETSSRQARRACRHQRVSRATTATPTPIRPPKRPDPSPINPKEIAMLSAALTRALTTPAFVAADFVPTQWDTAEQKAKFANALLTFVAQDFPRSKFHESFYRRLSNTFGQCPLQFGLI